MWDKRHHAAYIVSNLCFDPATLTAVDRPDPGARRHAAAAGRAGRAGGPDPAAADGGEVPGVAESARFLAGHADWLVRLGRPAATAPSGCWTGPGQRWPIPASAVEGLHVFTFNQVRQTEQWRRSLLERLAA